MARRKGKNYSKGFKILAVEMTKDRTCNRQRAIDPEIHTILKKLLKNLGKYLINTRLKLMSSQNELAFTILAISA